MKVIYSNSYYQITINESTREIHIKHLKVDNLSLRIGVNHNDFDLTADAAQFKPTSFNGLKGFRINQ